MTFVRLMNNLGGEILRKSTPLSKDNLIKLNILQGEDNTFLKNLSLKSKYMVNSNAASQPRLLTPVNAKRGPVAIDNPNMVQILSARNSA